METRSKEQCKIRKRGNSSSSSSSLVRKYRFKRAVLVGRRGGSSTPVPSWITSSKSPILSMADSDSKCFLQAKEASVSARKLAATLWEIDKISAEQLPDPSYALTSEPMDRSIANGNRRKESLVKKKLLLADFDTSGLDSVTNTQIEAHTRSKSLTEFGSGVKTRLKDVSNGMTTSKEILKVLNHVCGLDEQSSSGMSLVLALRVELDRAQVQVNQLIKEQRSRGSEIEYLIRAFNEEKVAWKRKERERMQNGIARIAEELEIEKRLRRQTERLNKKLGKELAETKASLSRVIKELDNEKRAKEILEQVCDELASGIGEDRAEVEQLKRETAKVREEVEKEREMLQLADVLREERVQMKLAEAKYQFEEKNAAVERLRGELEDYLRGKITKENGDEGSSPSYEKIKELEAYLKEIQFGSHQIGDREEDAEACANGEVYDGDESADGDLHSIELNMDEKRGSFKWNFDFEGNTLQNPRRLSVDKVFKGRNSIENIQWTTISLHKKNTNDLDLSSKKLENPDASDDKTPSSEPCFHSQKHDDEEETKNDTILKSLKGHIIFDSKGIPAKDIASPTQQQDLSFCL